MDKKNTLLLTVIAIATLLVAVVGATFAYFSAQVGKGASTEMNVTTSSEDTLSYSSFTPLYIIATQTNFAQSSTGQETNDGIGSQKGVATGKVEYRKGGGQTSKDYCYTATIKVTANTFGYPAFDGFDFKEDQDAPKGQEQHAPELVLNIKRVRKTKDDADGSNGTINYTQALQGTAGITADKYTTLTKNRRVCLQSGSSAETGTQGTTYNCEDNVEVKGYDVTAVSAEQEIQIPISDGETNIKHQLTATDENDTITDEWTAELVFVNYDWDQQYNVGKVFTATWNFANVECGGD